MEYEFAACSECEAVFWDEYDLSHHMFNMHGVVR